MTKELAPLITNKQLKELLARAKGMSKDHQDTMWEALIFVRGTYERERIHSLHSVQVWYEERLAALVTSNHD